MMKMYPNVYYNYMGMYLYFSLKWTIKILQKEDKDML
jgi:hypothetical protein